PNGSLLREAEHAAPRRVHLEHDAIARDHHTVRRRVRETPKARLTLRQLDHHTMDGTLCRAIAIAGDGAAYHTVHDVGDRPTATEHPATILRDQRCLEIVHGCAGHDRQRDANVALPILRHHEINGLHG